MACAALAAPSEGLAQITRDGTLGTGSGPLVGPNFQIGAELGRQVGGNLFHSFGHFNLRTSESATFGGPGTVNNVVGRVTGGSPSSIDGTIRSTIPGANLFLVNPSGLMFGPNASLDVGGAFHASTADYLGFADGARFQATNPGASTLTAAPPAAFGFLGPNPAPLTVSGSSLETPQGFGLSIVGGPVSISGAFVAAGDANVHVAVAAGAGEIPLEPGATLPSLTLGSVNVINGALVGAAAANGGASVFIRGGEIVVDNATVVGANVATGSIVGGTLALQATGDVKIRNGGQVNSSTSGAGRGQDILIEGRNVSVVHGPTIASRGRVSSNTAAGGRGGDITIRAAGTVTVAGPDLPPATPGLGISNLSALASANGNGGNLSISANTLTLSGSASISTESNGSGRGGSLTVNAAEDVNVIDQGQMRADSRARGPTGNVTINTKRLAVERFGIISSASSGAQRSGDITINASESVVVRDGLASISTSAIGDANGGALTIDTSDLTMIGLSSISSGNVAGFGSAGPISINADRLTLRGAGDEAQAAISSFAVAGSAGPIRINVRGAASLDNNATIQGSTFFGFGDAGSITLDAQSLAVTNGSLISTTALALARGGDVTITVSGPILISGRSILDASTSGIEQGGNLTLRARSIAIEDGGKVLVDTFGPGRGGNAVLQATELITVDARMPGNPFFTTGVISGSRMLPSSAEPPSGDAGTISVSAPRIVVRNGGALITTSEGSGKSGDVSVMASESLLLADAGTITATTTGSGSGGNVMVVAPTATLSNTGQITSDTTGSGQGGSVIVVIDGPLVLTQDSAALQNRISAAGFTASTGSAGDVTVRAGSLSVLGGGVITSQNDGAGAGGNVSVSVAGSILLSGVDSEGLPSRISARTEGAGSAGNVTITARSLTVRDGAQITTRATLAAGGSIDISAVDLVYLLDGEITTSVASGVGGGGNITIDPRFVILNNGRILARAVGGDGGDITIVAENFLASTDSIVNASSDLGIDGAITIEAPDIDVSGGLVTLSSDFAQRSELLRSACGGERPASSLAPTGRGGLAQDAEGAQPGLYLAERAAPAPGIAGPYIVGGGVRLASAALLPAPVSIGCRR